MDTTKNIVNSESLDLAFESIESCDGYIDYIVSLIHNMVASYHENDIAKADKSFIEIVELMDLYIQLITKVFSVIRLYEKDQILQKDNIQKLEIHLLSTIKSLMTAKEKNDSIIICDLLEYELVDNLKQWKTIILPELKKLKNT